MNMDSESSDSILERASTLVSNRDYQDAAVELYRLICRSDAHVLPAHRAVAWATLGDLASILPQISVGSHEGGHGYFMAALQMDPNYAMAHLGIVEEYRNGRTGPYHDDYEQFQVSLCWLRNHMGVLSDVERRRLDSIEA